VVLDIDGPPGRSVVISEFVFESGPVRSRVKGRAIVTAEGPPDLMSTTGYLDIRSGERSAIYRLVGAMSRMKSGRTVLDCTGFRQTDAAEFPVSTWIRLTVDETTRSYTFSEPDCHRRGSRWAYRFAESWPLKRTAPRLSSFTAQPTLRASAPAR
jgi:hypothetical protein